MLNSLISIVQMRSLYSRRSPKAAPCIGCATKTTALHAILQAPVCPACRTTDERFRLITKWRAKDEFALTDADLAKLPYATNPNPHCRSSPSMKLFLLQSVRERANEKEKAKPHLRFKKMRRRVMRMIRGGV
jgi:hypothetical protein